MAQRKCNAANPLGNARLPHSASTRRDHDQPTDLSGWLDGGRGSLARRLDPRMESTGQIRGGVGPSSERAVPAHQVPPMGPSRRSAALCRSIGAEEMPITGWRGSETRAVSAAAPLVRALNWADGLLDEVLYHPLTIQATRRLPRWWRCDLARIAIRIADATGDDDLAELNLMLCQACRRRMTWTEIGTDGDDGLPGPFAVCWWCHLYLPDAPMDEVQDWPSALAEAGQRSVGWRWRR